jgi:putative hemolysin
MLLFLFLSAYFAGTETASISANKARLKHLEMKGDERAREILRLLGNLQHVIAIVLVGNNVCLVLGSQIGGRFFGTFIPHSSRTFLGGSIGTKELVDLIILTPLFLIFAEILPKQIFRHKADKVIYTMSKPLKFFGILFLPILKLLEKITFLLLAPFGVKRGAPFRFTKGDLITLIENGKSERTIDSRSVERNMIRKILGMEKTISREIMIPINELQTVRLGKGTLKSVINLANETGFSRFPVYRDKVIDLIGYIDIYQILKTDLTDRLLEDFIRKAYYVPETKPVDDLLQQFLKRGEQVAIVVDEFGACSGWITLEDILEEIVGEIDDEFDHMTIDIIDKGNEVFEMEASIDIDDLNDRLGISLPKEGYETLGGLIFTRIGEIPGVGDIVKTEDALIEVLTMSGNSIDRVRLLRTIRPEEEKSTK